MSDSIIIRSIEAKDFVQWQLLWSDYNRFYGRNFLAPEVSQTTWSRFFDVNVPVHALVAEKNGMLVGLVHFLFHYSTSRIELSCYLQDLYTNESMRGQGVGSKLIQAVYNKAKTAGSSRVYWQTQENNAVARKLYDNIAMHLGFIVYSKEI